LGGVRRRRWKMCELLSFVIFVVDENENKGDEQDEEAFAAALKHEKKI
jgi:hypothetical protein